MPSRGLCHGPVPLSLPVFGRLLKPGFETVKQKGLIGDCAAALGGFGRLVVGTTGLATGVADTGQAKFFDVEERLRELTAKGDALDRLNAVVNFGPIPR